MSLRLLTIPLDESNNWEQVVVLDDREFRLTIEWSVREGAWYVSIASQDGVMLAAGLRLVEGTNVLRRETDPRLPQGKLMLADTTGRREETDRDSIGGRWVLVYDEAV